MLGINVYLKPLHILVNFDLKNSSLNFKIYEEDYLAMKNTNDHKKIFI